MSNNTSIEWTDHTWNFISAYAGRRRGWFCTKRTKACANCYAEAINLRLGNGLTYTPNNLDKVEFRVETKLLLDPLRWRTSRKVFVNSMTDFFHPSIPDWMRRIGFAVMMCRPKCWFQILTKQPEKMEQFFKENTLGDCFTEAMHRADDYPRLAASLRAFEGLEMVPAQWPLANVALLVSVGEQKDADEFIPYLLRTPAVVRGLSLEPLLGPVKLESLRINNLMPGAPGFDWLIIGGESGKKARPCNVEWIRSLIKQGRAADLAVFVKQLGAKPTMSGIVYAGAIPVGIECKHGYDVCPKCDSEDKPLYPKLKHKKGGNWSEWPADLRVREFPPGCEPRP